MPRASPPFSERIDKLTRSIEDRLTGESLPTIARPMDAADWKRYKKRDWGFDWKAEAKDSARTVYILTTASEPAVAQGFISLEDKGDHVFAHLIETARTNRGDGRKYLGVAGNLIAFACKHAFGPGYDGYISFMAKSALVAHYRQAFGAEVLHRQMMLIRTAAATALVARYFPNKA